MHRSPIVLLISYSDKNSLIIKNNNILFSSIIIYDFKMLFYFLLSYKIKNLSVFLRCKTKLYFFSTIKFIIIKLTKEKSDLYLTCNFFGKNVFKQKLVNLI